MLDDDLARKIPFFFFEREEILVAFDPIFLRLSSSVIQGGTGDREIEGEKGRREGWLRFRGQLCKSITWRGWVVSSRANLHQLLLFTR